MLSQNHSKKSKSQSGYKEKSMEGTLAEVRFFAGNFAPRCWAFCHGQIMPINQNEALFALLGTQYGGDGRTTFALPKIDDLNGCKAIICIEGIFPSRS